MNTVILVVLYNKNIKDSRTLSKLSKIAQHKTSLVIFNNGPKPLSEPHQDPIYKELINKYTNIYLCEDISNAPLSKIYNKFLVDFADYSRYVFLDDDTDIDQAFFQTSFFLASLYPADVQLPRIFSEVDNGLHYPRVNGDIPAECSKITLTQNDEFYSIGSGLIVFNSLLKKFNRASLDLFDERFALYGVDYSFFRRMRILMAKGTEFTVYSTITIHHSLSSMSGKREVWRERERLIDNVLTSKFYSKNSLIGSIKVFKTVIKQFVNRKFSNIIFIIKIFCRGKHPRC